MRYARTFAGVDTSAVTVGIGTTPRVRKLTWNGAYTSMALSCTFNLRLAASGLVARIAWLLVALARNDQLDLSGRSDCGLELLVFSIEVQCQTCNSCSSRI